MCVAVRQECGHIWQMPDSARCGQIWQQASHCGVLSCGTPYCLWGTTLCNTLVVVVCETPPPQGFVLVPSRSRVLSLYQGFIFAPRPLCDSGPHATLPALSFHGMHVQVHGMHGLAIVEVHGMHGHAVVQVHASMCMPLCICH